MKNGGKNKSVAFIILFSVVINLETIVSALGNHLLKIQY